ncbi:hypothetical protein EYZ11_004349 [Aspergillus tanneri]|uniref:Uncharacterized protein n=1 Tax=Aspergillus tanneri TaxID=1220188 RepID=A0A4S3JKU8_9EURO|nr:hypothetical protein EYZ11_004349 [Aspergillus tanneri]
MASTSAWCWGLLLEYLSVLEEAKIGLNYN